VGRVVVLTDVVVVGIDVVVAGIDVVVVVAIVLVVVTTGMDVAGEAERWLEDVQPAAAMPMRATTSTVPICAVGGLRV
jgi:hypothetical protein